MQNSLLQLKRLCIFCGSSIGAQPAFANAARELAAALASANITLVYGGSKVGIMGIIADAMLENGGEVIGVIPKVLLEKEIAHTGITQLHIVDSMHQRKALLSKLADGFIALPGGVGTLEEFFEVYTAAYLENHRKPCGILNIENYYDQLLKFLDHTVAMQFLEPIYRNMIIVKDQPQELLQAFFNYQAPARIKWTKEVTTI